MDLYIKARKGMRITTIDGRQAVLLSWHSSTRKYKKEGEVYIQLIELVNGLTTHTTTCQPDFVQGIFYQEQEGV